MSEKREQHDYDKDAMEAEQEYLRDLQAHQEIILKRTGIFSKGLSTLYDRHTQLQYAFEQGERRYAPRWQPPPLDGSDGTHAMVAVFQGFSKVNYKHPIQNLSVVFRTPGPDGPIAERHHIVTVAQMYEDLDAVLPVGYFDNDDAKIVSGLLGGVRQARAEGKLPHLRSTLADLGPGEPHNPHNP